MTWRQGAWWRRIPDGGYLGDARNNMGNSLLSLGAGRVNGAQGRGRRRFVEMEAPGAIGALGAAHEIVHGRSGTLIRQDLATG